jgi:two-component system, response regulator YesN
MRAGINMTKLLIVDDDEFIRTGIGHLVDWSELGVELAGFAKSGNEAYAVFLEKQPEIILTDIKMPDGDGLELIEKIRQKDWGTHIVVLSGYDDFNYVRQAMKFQVEDYLLKPVDADELIEIMKSCVNNVESVRVNEKAEKESFQLLRNNLLNRWVENRIDEEQLKEKLGFFDIDLRQYGYFQTAVIHWTDLREPEISESEKQFRSFSIHNSLEETMRDEGKGLCFLNADKQIVCIFMGPLGEGSLFADNNMRWLQEKAQHISSRLKTPCFAAMGSVSVNVQTVHCSYKEAIRVLHVLPLTGPSLCADSRYTDEAIGGLPNLSAREMIITSLTSGGSEQWAASFDVDFRWAALQDDPVSAAKYVAAKWIVLIRQTLQQLKLHLQDPFLEAELYSRLSEKHNLPEVKLYLLSILQQLEKTIHQHIHRKRNPLVDELVSYIHKHFDQEMSLQMLSHKMNVNNIYLGRLFKEEHGMLFSDYLTQIRMEEAKKLLRESYLKASEVAYKVGFTDPNYFFRKFKQLSSLSPSEYRKLHQNSLPS